MDVSFDQLMQFGVPLVILAFVGLGLWRAAKWAGQYVVLPVSNSGIEYLNKQTEATQKSVDSMEQIKKLDYDIRNTVVEMQTLHDDKNSCFSTVHTNASINLLAKAVQRVATASNVDINDLVNEIEKTLEKQES